MKKLLLVLIALILMLARSILPVDTFPLEGLSRPSIFLVNYNRAFVLDQATVYVYSLKDFKLIKKFGKAGEGPQEFKYNPQNGKPMSMCFINNQLMVNSDHRASYFDLDGNFIKEEKISVDKLIFPLKEKFVGVGLIAKEDKRQYLGVTLHEKKFTSQKKVFLSDFELNNPRKLLLPVTSFTYNPVYKDKIYVNANSIDFKINVYDSNGDKEFEINKSYPKLKIPESFKKEALTFFKQSIRFKRNYEFIKKVMNIRKNFPPIRDIQLSDDLIYVITFKRRGDLWECIKLDLKGNEKGRTFIMLNRYEHFTMFPILYSVYEKNIYTLVEDEEDEVWKIHTSKF